MNYITQDKNQFYKSGKRTFLKNKFYGKDY